MATTRKDIRQRIGGAGFCSDIVVSTASALGGAAGASLIDTTRPEGDGTFINGQIVVLTGAAAGDRRFVTNWVQSSGTYTPIVNFTAQIAAAVGYEVHRAWNADDKDAAINEAIRLSAARWARRTEDESLTMLANTYTYALAAVSPTIDPDLGIDTLEYETGFVGTGVPWLAFDDDFWYVRNDDGVLTLQLKALPAVGKKLRLTYRTRPTTLSTDAGTLAPDTIALYDYICAKATAILFDQRARKAQATQREAWQVEAAKMHQMAEAFLSVDKPPPARGKVKFPTYGVVSDDSLYPLMGE